MRFVPRNEAVIVTAVSTETTLVLTVNPAVELPEGTVTVLGTVAAAGTLLLSETTYPPLGALPLMFTWPPTLFPPMTVEEFSVTLFRVTGSVTFQSRIAVRQAELVVPVIPTPQNVVSLLGLVSMPK